MLYRDALAQISDIHAHLAKGEVYRGFRSLPVALSGAVGLLAAVVEPRFVAAGVSAVQVRYWLCAAIVCGLIGGGPTIVNFLWRDDAFARRRTLRVLGQFAPALVAGWGITLAISRFHQGPTFLLPGLWSVVFGLGVFAARPYLPRATGWVALHYLLTGCGLLWCGEAVAPLFGWAVGGTFGAGQAAAALVLFWNLERRDDG